MPGARRQPAPSVLVGSSPRIAEAPRPRTGPHSPWGRIRPFEQQEVVMVKLSSSQRVDVGVGDHGLPANAAVGDPAAAT